MYYCVAFLMVGTLSGIGGKNWEVLLLEIETPALPLYPGVRSLHGTENPWPFSSSSSWQQGPPHRLRHMHRNTLVKETGSSFCIEEASHTLTLNVISRRQSQCDGRSEMIRIIAPAVSSDAATVLLVPSMNTSRTQISQHLRLQTCCIGAYWTLLIYAISSLCLVPCQLRAQQLQVERAGTPRSKTTWNALRFEWNEAWTSRLAKPNTCRWWVSKCAHRFLQLILQINIACVFKNIKKGHRLSAGFPVHYKCFCHLSQFNKQMTFAIAM